MVGFEEMQQALTRPRVTYHWPGGHYPTPKYIPPHTIINLQNNDNSCFKWAVLLAVYEGAKDHSKYEARLGDLDFTGTKFPVKTSNINKFEHQNPTITVILYGWQTSIHTHTASQQSSKITSTSCYSPTKPTSTTSGSKTLGVSATRTASKSTE